MADAFLGYVMSDAAWIGIGFLFLYGFTGRWGLEWLSSMKGTTITTTSQSKKVEITDVKEESSNENK